MIEVNHFVCLLFPVKFYCLLRPLFVSRA